MFKLKTFEMITLPMNNITVMLCYYIAIAFPDTNNYSKEQSYFSAFCS